MPDIAIAPRSSPKRRTKPSKRLSLASIAPAIAGKAQFEPTSSGSYAVPHDGEGPFKGRFDVEERRIEHMGVLGGL